MRPLSVTVMCILLFGVGISLTLRSIAQLFLYPGIYTFLMIGVSILGLYCYYGLWKMKSWSIPLFYLLWIIIPLPMFLGFEGQSVIVVIRESYFVALLIIFSIVVLPHRSKFHKASIWDFKS